MSWSLETEVADSSVDGDLFAFNNAWWAATTPSYPDGLVLYLASDGTLRLYDVAGASVAWSSTASVSSTTAAKCTVATRSDSDRVVVVWADSGGALIVADSDAGYSEVTVSASRHSRCREPAAVLCEHGEVVVVYTAEEAGLTRVFYVLFGASWTGAYPLDTITSSSTTAGFASVACGTSADPGETAQSTGAGVVVFAWREDASRAANIKTRSIGLASLFKGTLVADFNGNEPWGNPDQSTSATLTASTSPEDSRDPCVWCTAEGRFFLAYSRQYLFDYAVACVMECSAPADGGAWSGPTELDTENTKRTQNFVNGHCDSTAGYAVAVWEYGRDADGTKQTYAAVLDLNDASATWRVLEQVSSEPEGEYAETPTVWVDAGGTFVLATLWKNADQTAFAVRVRVGTPR